MIAKSKKLEQVSYDIRGPIYQKSQEFAQQGIDIIQLNIGNPAPYGFEMPAHLLEAVAQNMRHAQGYVSSNGIEAARESIHRNYQAKGVPTEGIQHIYIGNGVSELISISLQALLNSGDEVLLPSPDYPLWTSTVNLCGGRAVHYCCDESSAWLPDLGDIRKKITPKTKALVIINPNNPTGAVYPESFLHSLADIAREHRLLLLSDEIYDHILYDGEQHHPMGSIAGDLPCITYGGLSKNYMATGLRAGWMAITGSKHMEKGFFEGLDILMSMRLCSNAPSQFAITAALDSAMQHGPVEIEGMVAPGGRLCKQRDYAYERLLQIPGITCQKAKGAMYLFPRIDMEMYGIKDDSEFVLRFLTEEKVLLVQGTGFNWKDSDHFRMTFLPSIPVMEEALNRLEGFLSRRHIGSSSPKAILKPVL